MELLERESSKFILYNSDTEKVQVDTLLDGETLWLTANQMAELFDKDEKTIRKHINNIFNEDELDRNNNTHFLRVVGVKQPVAFYNLDVIIAVGYRVNSRRATHFRIWATNILKEYVGKTVASTMFKGKYIIFHEAQRINSDFEKQLAKAAQGEKDE